MPTTNALRRAIALMFTALLAFPAASNDAYPQKPVKVIVPYGAGGASDLIARKVGEGLSRMWKQPVVVENRAGGNTITGSEFVAKAAADGYTLLWTSNAHVILPSLYERLPYDWTKDFSPVTQVALIPQVVIARPGLPYRTLAELIVAAKQKPDTITYGTSGSGSPGHLAGELLNETAGIKLRHIPYKGAGPALNDLLGGHVDLMFNGVPASVAQISGGKVGALGMTTKARLAALPNVPTVAEQGFPGYEASTWVGLYAPARTPVAIIDRMQKDIATVLATKEVTDWLREQGLAPVGSTPAVFQAVMEEEHSRWNRVIKRAGIKAE